MTGAPAGLRSWAPSNRRFQELAFGVVALAAALAFALSFGLNYGVGNQTGYMLGALRLLDPTILATDWYAAETTNFHPAFSYLGWLLLTIDRDGWAVGVGFVVVAASGAMCVYWLTWELLSDRRMALATYLLVLGLAFVTRTQSVAVSYIFEPILQPSALGSLFLLAAIAPFVAGRYLISGVFLGLSGLFHANYLILGIGAFGLAHLLFGMGDIKELVLRLSRQLAPSMAIFVLLSPLIFASLGSADAERAKEILFSIRSPHHYVPTTFKDGFVLMAAWQMMGIGAGAWLLRYLAAPGRRLGALILAFASVIWLGTLFTTWIWVPQVAQAFVWRFAPFLDLLMQFLLCAAVVQLAVRPERLRLISPTGLALVLGGLVLVAIQEIPDRGRGLLVTIAWALLPAFAGVVFGGLGRVWRQGRRPVPRASRMSSRGRGWLVLGYAGAMCAVLAMPYVEAIGSRSNLISGFKGPEADLYGWLRTNTPKDAVFLTPPEMLRFRIGAERAIVVDWKSSPYLPGDVLEWYRRLEDVSGQQRFQWGKQVFRGYASLDEDRLEALRTKYRLDYAVVRRGREAGLPGRSVYLNRDFVVLDLGPLGKP